VTKKEKAANGRSTIYRSAERPAQWESKVSFPSGHVTGKPVRKKVRGRTRAEVIAVLGETWDVTHMVDNGFGWA